MDSFGFDSISVPFTDLECGTRVLVIHQRIQPPSESLFVDPTRPSALRGLHFDLIPTQSTLRVPGIIDTASNLPTGIPSRFDAYLALENEIPPDPIAHETRVAIPRFMSTKNSISMFDRGISRNERPTIQLINGQQWCLHRIGHQRRGPTREILTVGPRCRCEEREWSGKHDAHDSMTRQSVHALRIPRL